MAATIVQAPQTAAIDINVTVVAGTPVHLGLYTAAGPVPSCQCLISRKNPAGTFAPTGYVLTSADPSGDAQKTDINFNMVAAGDYVIHKPATTIAIGVFKD